MEEQLKQDISTGSGSTETLKPENEKGPTAELSKPSQENIATELASTLNEAPNSPEEALALLQTRLFDLYSLKLPIKITANPDTGRLYIVIEYPGRSLGFENGHILVDKKPVVSL